MRGGPGSILNVFFGLGVVMVMGCAWLLFYLVLFAIALVCGMGWAVREIYRAFRKSEPKTEKIQEEPRPVESPVGPGKGPRDWSTSE